MNGGSKMLIGITDENNPYMPQFIMWGTRTYQVRDCDDREDWHDSRIVFEYEVKTLCHMF